MSLDSFHTRVAPKLHQGCIKVAENIAQKEMQPKTLGCTILLASMFNIQVLSGLTRLSY